MTCPRCFRPAPHCTCPPETVLPEEPHEIPEKAPVIVMPCPFCGKEPVTKPVPGAFQITTKTIECRNGECPVKPCVTGETLGKVVAKWNTRQGDVEIAKLVIEMMGLGMKAKKLVEGN